MIRPQSFCWNLVLLLAAIPAAAARLVGQEPAAVPPWNSALEKLREAIQWEVADKRLPAFSIAIVDGDRTVWADGFAGPITLSNSKTSQAAQPAPQPITADTVYRVGSVSKLFTDIAAMQLVEAGQLDLDAAVEVALPSFQPRNPFGPPITLRQLMSHQSGLVREPPVGHYFDPDEPSVTAAVSSLNRTSLVYPPGQRTKYSNAGIAVVGACIEKITGQAYAQRIAERILQPLDMQSSSFVLTPELNARLAPATMWTRDGRRFPAPQFAIGTAPAGNLYASVNDLAKFIRCIHRQGRHDTGVLLQPETWSRMMTPERDSVGKPHPFALGFHVNELDGHRRIGHGGAVYGCATQLEILPEQQLGVAAVAALDCANGTVERLVNYALRLLLATRQNKPLPTYARTQPVPESRAKSLVGTYRHENSVVEIRYLDNRLMLQRGVLQNELRLEPTSGEIMVDDVLAHGTTVRSAADGQLSIQDKLYAPVAEGPPPAPPQIWEGLIGEYGWDHNTLYILEYHGHLVALIEWFYAYPLTQLGPDEYAFPDYGLYHGEKLVFQRDSQGLATQVIAAEVPFLRRSVGTFQGKTFKIEPLRPVERLRAEAAAAEPPKEAGDFRDSQLTELKQLVPDLALDIRYATTNNFVGSVFYDAPQAFLQRPAAEAVARVDSRLRQQRLGLLIHDAYRPWFVTKMFWEATPDGMKDFVANPATGSRHNRGCAVDLSLIDLAKQQPIEMVSGYDEFSQRAFPNYPGGTTRQRWYRDLLRTAMESEGFNVYQFEWWHFDFADWKKYRLENKTFDQIR